MSSEEIIDLIKRRKLLSEIALHDLKELDGDEIVKNDIIRLEQEIYVYKCLLQDTKNYP